MKFIATALLATLASTHAFAPASSSSTRFSFDLNAQIQFVRGLDEKVVPDVKLTRARDGSSGVATFNFVSPNVFDVSCV